MEQAREINNGLWLATGNLNRHVQWKWAAFNEHFFKRLFCFPEREFEELLQCVVNQASSEHGKLV